MTRARKREYADAVSAKSLAEKATTLPVSAADGGAAHLTGRSLPALALPSAHGEFIRLDRLNEEAVIFIFPMIGRPGDPVPPGWDDIPGARGCTPEACAFRDVWHHFQVRGVQVVGVSTQHVLELRDASSRLHLPYQLLSDARGHARRALSLPLFRVGSQTFLKRLTLVIEGGVITRTFYPVLRAGTHPYEVLDYLRRRERSTLDRS